MLEINWPLYCAWLLYDSLSLYSETSCLESKRNHYKSTHR